MRHALLLALCMLAAPVSIADPQTWPIAVLGDSDSQAFHDTLWTPAGRGGDFAAHTFQWTEILARLRGTALDPGPWGVWGTRKTLARLLDLAGLPARAPRKADHRNNFAFAGARCADLHEGVFRQAPRLRALMDSEPARWQRGVVVVRIGINGLGWRDTLDAMSVDPSDPAVRALADGCVLHIRNAVALLQQGHPQTRFVLVGLLNNADWPPYLDRWRSAREMNNIQAGIDRFDDALRAMAQADSRIAFFDDRAWFARRWGGRGPDGAPAYRPVTLSSGTQVTLSQGDDPHNAVLSDGHAGLAWNAMWAQSLVELLRLRFGAPLPAISDDEVAAFVTQALQSPPGGTR